MSRFQYAALVMLVSLFLPAGCGAGRNQVLRDPVAQSGASSEELWYRDGGARVAYTAIVRPRQLYAGYGTAPDPALYGRMPATTPAPRKRSTPKPKVEAPKTPECPPCPPADASRNTPQNATSQASPASSDPARDAADSTSPFPTAGFSAPFGSSSPFPSTLPPSGDEGTMAASPNTPRIPLPGMPAATPAPAAPGGAPGR